MLIEKADFIFLGTTQRSSSNWWGFLNFKSYNYYTRFEISEVIKGDEKNEIDIFYNYSANVSSTISPLRAGQEYIVFARKDVSTGKYYFKPCFQNIISMQIVEKIKTPHAGSEYTFLDLKALIDQYPDIKQVMLVQKVKEMERNFKRAIVKTHVFHALFEKGEDENLEKELSIYDSNPRKYICTDTLGVKVRFHGQREVLLNCD